MSYGATLGLSLPSLADTMTDVVSKTTVALATIEDVLEQRVTPAALDLNAALDLQGNAITNVGSVLLTGGNVPVTAGSFYYRGGAFYVRDAVGVIQLTSLGTINIGAVGTITGDYGGVNPARVTYVDGPGQYQFTEEPGVWADIACNDLIMYNAAGTPIIFGVHASATAGTFRIKSLPTSGKRLLCYDYAQQAVIPGDFDVAGTVFTGSHHFVDLYAVDFKHSSVFEKAVPHLGDTINCTRAYTGVSATAAPWFYTSQALDLRVGDKPTQLRIVMNKPTAGTVTVSVKRRSTLTGTLTDIIGPLGITTVGATVDTTIDAGTAATTLIAGDSAHVFVSSSTNADVIVRELHIGWVHQ